MKTFGKLLLWWIVGSGLLHAYGQTVELYPTVSTTDIPRISVPFTFEIDVHNDGPVGSMASGVVATATIPPEWTIVSYSAATYVQLYSIYDGSLQYWSVSATNTANTIQFQAGNIPNGFWRPMWVTVIPNQPGSFNVPIQVSSPQTDTKPWNNSLNYPVTVHSNTLFVVGGQSVLENSGSNITFQVTLSPPSTNTVTVNYVTVDGTAVAGQDYQFTSGMLTFAPGVTNLSVGVPVLDDLLSETPSQSFTLQLINAVNAEISGINGQGFVLDNEPALVANISNAPPVLEGDAVTNLLFPITLSAPSDVPVTISFSATQAIALSGTLAIPAGVTTTNLAIQIVGDLTVQSNRDVLVTLTGVSPSGSLGNSTAMGTIIEDDGQPGKFAYMTLSTVPSPQLAGRPFQVTISAKDSFNNPATNFNRTIEIDAYSFTNYVSHFVQTTYVSNFVNGAASVSILYPSTATNAVIGAWLPIGTGNATALTPTFRVISSPPLLVSLPASAAEGDGLLPGAGRVSLTNADVQDITVQLSSSDTQEIIVPPSVFIPAGQTSVVFDVTVVDDTRLDGTHSTFVTATSSAYASGSAGISVADNERAVLSLTLPSGLSEAKGANSGTAKVSSSAAPDWPLLVSLTSSDVTELTVPCCVYIQAGQTSATFTVSVPNDNYVDGPQNVSVTAHVANWVDAVANTTVQDDDSVLLFGNGIGNDQGQAYLEGSGTITNRLVVGSQGIVSNDLVVQLTSSKPAKLAVPAAVLIPAGQSAVTTNIFIPDDSLFDGTQSVTVTSTAPGFTNGTITFTIFDNDVHHITFGAISGSRTSGVPFSISITVKDTNGVTISPYPGSATLALLINGQTFPLSPFVATNFVRGIWNSSVTASNWGANAQILATAINGMSGTSGFFDILPPAWAADLKIKQFQVDASGAHLFFNSFTGHFYQVEFSTNLLNWSPTGSPQSGTGSEISLTLPLTDHRSGFYRLAVTP